MGRLGAANKLTGATNVVTFYDRIVKMTDVKDRFTYYCRAPGSRCNAIMTLIEAGLNDYEIGLRFGETPDTIAVYRKELYAYAGRADGAGDAGAGGESAGEIPGA